MLRSVITLPPRCHPSQTKSSQASSTRHRSIGDMLLWIMNSITYINEQTKASLLLLPQELLVQIAREANSLHDVRALLLTCRHLARICRHLIFQRDIKHGYGVSLLYAAVNNDPDLAVRAILAGMDVDATIPQTDEAAIHLRCLAKIAGYPRSLEKWTALQLSAYCDSKDVARILIDNGAHMNAGLDVRGRSPLHLSIYYCSIKTSRLLIECGADIMAPDAEGVLPLHYAAITGGGAEMIPMLLRAGVPVDVETTGTSPVTPLYMAIQYGCQSGALRLLESGANAPSGISEDWDALLFAGSSSTEGVATVVFQVVDQLQQIHDYAQFLEIICSKGWSKLVALVVYSAKNNEIISDTLNKYGKPLTYIEQYARRISRSSIPPQSSSELLREHTAPEEVIMGGYKALFTMLPDSTKNTVAVIEILLKHDQTTAVMEFYGPRTLDSRHNEDGSPLMFALKNNKRNVVAFMRDVLSTWTS